MTKMLASVASLHEAQQALAWGADIIDLKNPNDGALGAVALDVIAATVRVIAGQRLLSATIGDTPDDVLALKHKIHTFAATGIDIIKIGIATSQWPKATQYQSGTWQCLRQEPASVRLVAVLFADQQPDFTFIDTLANCGFYGAMLDTADKFSGGLRTHQSNEKLAAFVSRVRARGLLCGLAGSLCVADVEPLLELQPDYLGFRGALCRGTSRTEALDPISFASIRNRIPIAQFADA